MGVFSFMIKGVFVFLGVFFQFFLPLMIKAMLFLLMFAFFALAIQTSFMLAPIIGLVFGTSQAIYAFSHIRSLRARLARERDMDTRWGSVSDNFSTVYTIATYGFQREYKWLKISEIENNVAPGDDTRPDLENGFVRILPGPAWVRGVHRLCLHIVLFFSVPGIWIGVVILSVLHMLLSLPRTLAYGIAGLFRARRPGEG